MRPASKGVGVISVMTHPAKWPLLEGPADVIRLRFAKCPGGSPMRAKEFIGVSSPALAVPEL